MSDSKLQESIHEDAKAYNDYASVHLELSEPHLSDQGLWSAIRSSRDIDQNKRRNYLYHAYINGQQEGQQVSITSIPPVELPESILARIASSSGEKVAIFREENSNNGDRKQVLEVWTDYGHSLLRRILLPEKQHGKLIFDAATFGGPSWNANETVMVYVAERKAPSTVSFFDSPFYEESQQRKQDDNEVGIRGGTHTLGYGKSDTWGEKYSKQAPLSDFFLVNVETGRVGKVENCPGAEQKTTLGSYVLCRPVFEPNLGQAIVYTAYDAGGGTEMPRRLGLIHCQQRPSQVYSSSVAKLLEQLAAAPQTNTDDSTSCPDLLESVRKDSSALETNPEEAANVMENKNAPYYCLTVPYRLALSPVFSPVYEGQTKMVFLSSKNGFYTHSGCFSLSCITWIEGVPVMSSERILLPMVWDPNESPLEYGTVFGMKFPGFFLLQLSKWCFLSHNYMLVSTDWGSSQRIVRVSLETGAVSLVQHASSLDGPESDTVLCVHPKQGVMCMSSSPNKIPAVWHVPTSRFVRDENSIVLHDSEKTFLRFMSSPIAASKFSPTTKVPELEFGSSVGFWFDKDLRRVEHVDIERDFVQTILLLPKHQSTDGDLPPLIVVPHGGPHGVSSTSYLPSFAYLCAYGGYAVALVNYRGSTGFGQGLVESLPGRVGDLDVKDVVAVTLQLKESGLIDKTRVGICGGSHGGFLTAHCTGQYPELFRAAVMRNPVTNLPSMVTATDIPDWVYVEAFGKYDWKAYRPPSSEEEISLLWSKSPIRYIANVKTPTLIALGMQDLRVPPSQGLEWYHSLVSLRVPTKLLMYEENDHAIPRPAAEADHWVNAKRWFDEHL